MGPVIIIVCSAISLLIGFKLGQRNVEKQLTGMAEEIWKVTEESLSCIGVYNELMAEFKGIYYAKLRIEYLKEIDKRFKKQQIKNT